MEFRMAPEWIWELPLTSKASAAMEQIMGYQLPNAIQNNLYVKRSLTIRAQAFPQKWVRFPLAHEQGAIHTHTQYIMFYQFH